MSLFAPFRRSQKRPLTVTFEVQHTASGKVVARIREIPGIVAEGHDDEQAFGGLTFALEQHVAVALERERARLLPDLRGHQPEPDKEQYQVTLA